MIANLTNESTIDTCKVTIWNSTDSYASPTLSITTGTIQQLGTQTQCNASWDMEYWRWPGDWNVSIDVNLTDGVTDNDNTSYYYNTITSHTLDQNYINFSGTPGQEFNSSNAYPLTIQNTGNKIMNISILGTDFVGTPDSSINISIGNATYSDTESSFTPITTSYVQITALNNLQPAATDQLYFRGTIPAGTKAQDYQNTISIRSD